jgi:hypothetical protein
MGVLGELDPAGFFLGLSWLANVRLVGKVDLQEVLLK